MIWSKGFRASSCHIGFIAILDLSDHAVACTIELPMIPLGFRAIGFPRRVEQLVPRQWRSRMLYSSHYRAIRSSIIVDLTRNRMAESQNLLPGSISTATACSLSPRPGLIATVFPIRSAHLPETAGAKIDRRQYCALPKLLPHYKLFVCFMMLGEPALLIQCERSHKILCFINEFSIWIRLYKIKAVIRRIQTNTFNEP